MTTKDHVGTIEIRTLQAFTNHRKSIGESTRQYFVTTLSIQPSPYSFDAS